MQEELVSFETAKLAKEKGFILSHPLYLYDENGKIINLKKSFDLARQTFILDSKTTLAPTQSLLQKWLREVYNTHLMVEPFYNEQKVLVYGLDIITERIEEETIVEKGFKTYEEALEVGLQEALKLIEIVKEK
jgi:hypothetical protein